jgi:hypothetical protein
VELLPVLRLRRAKAPVRLQGHSTESTWPAPHLRPRSAEEERPVLADGVVGREFAGSLARGAVAGIEAGLARESPRGPFSRSALQRG